MKRLLQFICLLGVAALLPAAFLISRGLPADTRPYVEQKYSGWNGVLRAWVCADWECAGSFTRWLNACAASFEKAHGGVYIEFTPVRADILQHMTDSGIRPPELIFFSPGTLTDLSALKKVSTPDALREELQTNSYAYPVAMGGYIWVYNRELQDGVPSLDSIHTALPDDTSRSFSAAMVALLSDSPSDTSSEEVLPEAGLDLGLPTSAFAQEEGAAFTVADDALNRFIAGELPAIAITQAELARLIRLQDNGRGPDWFCAAAGQAAFTDQLLMMGVVSQSGDSAAEREYLAEAFAAELLTYDAQARLTDIGAFSVTGERIYSDFSAYAPLDALLNSRELLVADNLLHSSPDCARLLRARMDGTIGPEVSLVQLKEALY